MFHYDICTVVDRDIFEKQCKALENLISLNFLNFRAAAMPLFLRKHWKLL